jgi:small subunit ribosomal protein S16
LTRVGATKRPAYRVIAIDKRRSRDGRALEILGFYDPLTEPATVQLDRAKIDAWIGKGAQPSDTVVKLLRQSERAATAGAEEEKSKRATRAAKPKPSKKAQAKAAAVAESPAETEAAAAAEAAETPAPEETPAEEPAVGEEPAATVEPEAAQPATDEPAAADTEKAEA